MLWELNIHSSSIRNEAVSTLIMRWQWKPGIAHLLLLAFPSRTNFWLNRGFVRIWKRCVDEVFVVHNRTSHDKTSIAMHQIDVESRQKREEERVKTGYTVQAIAAFESLKTIPKRLFQGVFLDKLYSNSSKAFHCILPIFVWCSVLQWFCVDLFRKQFGISDERKDSWTVTCSNG